MKFTTFYLKKSEPVTVCDGIRPPFAADLIGLSYYLGKEHGTLQIRTKIKSVGYGEELVERYNVCSNIFAQ